MTQAQLLPESMQCGPNEATTEFGTCVNVDGATQLTCPAGATPAAIPCMAVDSDQVRCIFCIVVGAVRQAARLGLHV
jgi:hypothetical protein